ncbi:MAG: hypothetical protein JRH08_01815 [Deltaproteobacteria bacterium]|nr:hypothetical protein [Deltaproteobacteria bacterium]MBW1927995.1 hypothetical protein [Deltaproteobacteria bacterium]MBW2024156.1 hypothetical protein [Deltaproteobacteria bacterium]MBW2124438.1 hypothetical protein [Deltaproteobacteria bacterium]
MNPDTYVPGNGFPKKDTFRFIKPDEYTSLGIDAEDIPIGTFPALKHPAHLPSRFGGNAYGSGIFEIYDRLKADDIRLLQRVSFENPEELKKHYKVINRIYKKMGLLIRVSRLGKPYYLIPAHLVSNTLHHIRIRLEEISKIIQFHRKKYLKEQYVIGVLTHKDDLIFNELSYRFKEHRFVLMDSLTTLSSLPQELDLVVLTRDIYELLLLENFAPIPTRKPSKKRLDEYAHYILWKLHRVLKPGGELFVIAYRHVPKINETTHITFKTEEEGKNFALFSHIFKTQQRYQMENRSMEVNVFDLQSYLRDFYVEQEVLDRLLQGKNLDELTMEEVSKLPYLDYPLRHWPFAGGQEKAWAKLLTTFFDQIFLKPLVPKTVKEDWNTRFIFKNYQPSYMLIFLGQKKPPETDAEQVKERARSSHLLGCPFHLVADYRDSFRFVIDTLKVVEGLKRDTRKDYPELVMDRLKQPLENKRRRFPALNDVLRLVGKIPLLKRMESYLNPGRIEGPETKILENLEALSFFGFTQGELEEIVYIIAGHTSMGRVLSGKVNEKSLKPVSDLARTFDPQRALNLLRYCRLMTMAELEASRGMELSSAQLKELFDLYESAVRVVMNRDLDWDKLLDERITASGGIHNEIMAKCLKMMNYYDFLGNWLELKQKGPMEKETLADYDQKKLSRLENVIDLINTVNDFERRFLKGDPLELASFYRKLLNVEFHGTGRIFSRLSSRLVFTLIWITVNVIREETVINFNPLLANLTNEEIDQQINRIEKEGSLIKREYLGLPFLKILADQLYENKTTFIVGTGFQLKIDASSQSLEVGYVDIDKGIQRLKDLTDLLARKPLTQFPKEKLSTLETLFFDLESFYQSHQTLLSYEDPKIQLPLRQTKWYQAIAKLREALRSEMLEILFDPSHFFTHLDLLYHHARSLLKFILPEFTALEELDLSGSLYIKSPVTQYILKSAKKMQALIQRDRDSFQDQIYLHQLAQREFGPMAAGIIGVNEHQIEELEKIVAALRANEKLFNALIKAFIFQDIGRVPELREKYANQINPADLSEAGVLFLKRENFAERYHMDDQTLHYLLFIVHYHDLIHHIIRGEIHFDALREILEPQDKELLDALFLFSLIMLSAIREDLIVEDLAQRLFRVRDICLQILEGKSSFATELENIHRQRGLLFHAVARFQRLGPEAEIQPHEGLESVPLDVDQQECIRSGRMVFAMERLFRLRGIRYVEFKDIANFMLKVPLQYIYKKRAFSSIGYPTFEREIFEAFRLYNTLQNLAEPVRHAIFEYLSGDKVRVYGYEKISGFLSYENQIKILLLTLLACKRLRQPGKPSLLNFLPLCNKIEKRYEALNHFLNSLPVERIWNSNSQIIQLFKAKRGLILTKDTAHNALSVDFRDRVDIDQKISYMEAITNLDQLKNYYYYSLRSLRKYPFQTDDYEKRLEMAYEKRMKVITEAMVKKFQEQMEVASEFVELHDLVQNLLSRSYEIGFSTEQRQRILDLYELQKEKLRREKLRDIQGVLASIHERQELEDYWNSIKWYLHENRPIVGKEFESLIARQFDRKIQELESQL